MSLNEHDRIDPGWRQPTDGAAPYRDARGVGSRESVRQQDLLKTPDPFNTRAPHDAAGHSHPHRSYFTPADLDLTARLEWLDDLMFAAIEGDPVALDHAAGAWHKTRDELGDIAIEESRLQYMRRAQSIWRSLRSQPNHPPHKVFAAIEIISLLATKAR